VDAVVLSKGSVLLAKTSCPDMHVVILSLSLQLLPCSSSTADMCESDSDTFISVPLPPLASSFTNHTPPCSSRIHQSVVYYDALDSIYIFGGMSLSGVVCAGDMFQVNLGPLRPESGSGEWAWSEGEGSGSPGDSVVNLVGVDGLRPSGRYLHTANLFQVSIPLVISSLFHHWCG
jgi:hypothetical protein